ncbi:hypothetical protein I8H84_00255 [Candidatus Saccharibacteria bacterium]|nr:hypothetical protein [Candidatus Saccharibacteria bacterium]MBH1972384.1 hypothetical protein [Candidatus Saccharibacteria bacterium]MBH1990274.1 hypothetical protein [Candidatus Saccharibacteria bacterium]
MSGNTNQVPFKVEGTAEFNLDQWIHGKYAEGIKSHITDGFNDNKQHTTAEVNRSMRSGVHNADRVIIAHNNKIDSAVKDMISGVEGLLKSVPNVYVTPELEPQKNSVVRTLENAKTTLNSPAVTPADIQSVGDAVSEAKKLIAAIERLDQIENDWKPKIETGLTEMKTAIEHLDRTFGGRISTLEGTVFGIAPSDDAPGVDGLVHKVEDLAADVAELKAESRGESKKGTIAATAAVIVFLVGFALGYLFWQGGHGATQGLFAGAISGAALALIAYIVAPMVVNNSSNSHQSNAPAA